MKATEQIRRDVLAWIALKETSSHGEDYGHRILECLGEIEEYETVKLSPAEVETLEVYADGSVYLLGDHSQGVMRQVLEGIVKRAKTIA